MAISDEFALIGGAGLGSFVSEFVSMIIARAKEAKEFKPLSEGLASMLERLFPILFDLVQRGLENDELGVLFQTIQRADEVTLKGSDIWKYNFVKKAYYTRKIKRINQDFLNFCQIDLQIIQHRNLSYTMHSMATVTGTNDLLSYTRKEFSEIFMVPLPTEVMVSWLERPLRELKRMLFEDGVAAIIVSAPFACGKSTLVTKLCHDDPDVKGRFKHIFFIAGSKRLNAMLILQRLFQLTGCKAIEFEKGLDARISIQQLLEQLGQQGPLLLVLDDVRPGEESFLEKFLIPFPGYKVLVTSRFEFPRFGPSYHLDRVIDEDFKTLLIHSVPQHNCLSCAKRDEFLKKILKFRNALDENEEEQLAKAVEKIFVEEGKGKQLEEDENLFKRTPHSVCGRCYSEIEDGRSVHVLGALWHADCLWCDACDKPIAIHEFENHVSNARGMYHKSCYEGYCYICKEKKMSEYHMNPFWKERYCPSHETDGTPKCCSCERLEPRGTNYAMLPDRRWQCRDCNESSIMEPSECQSLQAKIREFLEPLNVKVDQKFPFLLVAKQELNKRNGKEKIDDNERLVKGVCRSIKRSISVIPKMGKNTDLVGTKTESYMDDCYEVVEIKVMYGLPRLLTGKSLAELMVHAWFMINGYRDFESKFRKWLSKVIAHMWLESQSCAHLASSSHTEATPTKQTMLSDFEKKLLDLYMPVEDAYSFGCAELMKVKEMISKSGLQETVKYYLKSKV